MSEIKLFTYDRIPGFAVGLLRDIRIRWVLEEAGLPYSIETTSFNERTSEHLCAQPFAQIPWIIDNGRTIFESGAILLHLAKASDRLNPANADERSAATSWLFAALNTIEIAAAPWFALQASNDEQVKQAAELKLAVRLAQLESAIPENDWIVGSFSFADVALADVLRVIGRTRGISEFAKCSEYVARATARPHFKKAIAAHSQHYAQRSPKRA